MTNINDADMDGRRVILINGPPRAGKDTAAAALLASLPYSEMFRLSGALKDATHALYGLRGCHTDAYESVKDQPLADFHGKVYRDALIEVSEQCVKPSLGRDFFGRVLVSRIRRAAGMRFAVVPDSGFDYEAAPVVRAVGAANVLLLRIHREGFDFSRDSRSYIELPGVATLDLWNTDKAQFEAMVCAWVGKWVAGYGPDAYD